MKGEIVNRVSNSPLETIDIKSFSGSEDLILIDFKDFLKNEFVLIEKDFREKISSLDTNRYSKKCIAINCSNDAIIPPWAYMLLVSKLEKITKKIVLGDLEYLEKIIFLENIKSFDFSIYDKKKVIIKGCSDLNYVNSLYSEIIKKILPFADSIMYGEPCSTVPIFKRKK
tara:strand:- start:617 stop:1126 length:510 start_codon:yes stop_codon:yes gene_type:complete